MAKASGEQIEEIEVGEELVSWETWEFPPSERSRTWYVIAAILSIALILYAVIAENYMFAVVLLLMGVMLLVNSLRKPERITVYITSLGIVLGNDFYPYKDLKDFAIVYNPPQVKNLYITFISKFQPMLVIPLENANPNAVREALLPNAFENLEREDEDLTDVLRRVYKF